MTKPTEQPEYKPANRVGSNADGANEPEQPLNASSREVVENPKPCFPPEQPNQNLMKFEQIEGCCDIIVKLLNELVPKTEQVEGCIITHNSWEHNNLKHLKGAFE